MEHKKLKWKDVYRTNRIRKYNEVTGIKETNIELESNSFKALKRRKYLVVIVALIVIALLVWTFRNNIKMLFIVLAFFAVASIGFFVFNYFKLRCDKDGLYIRFGLQEGKFTYDKIKNVYLSKFSDYNFLIPSRKMFSIVIRYTDNLNKLKELSFPNYFLAPEDMDKFLSNFNIKDAGEDKYVQYERFKLFRRLGKVVIFLLFALLVISMFFLKK